MEKKNTRRSLWACGLSIILCLAMLIGTTLAWFSDTVSNKGNRIQAGNLNVQFYKYTGEGAPGTLNTSWSEIDNETEKDFIFGEDFKNWEPGAEKTIYLAVKNAGTLNLKYNMDLVIQDNTLTDTLLYGVSSNKTSPEAQVNADGSIAALIKNGVIAAAPNGRLDAGEVEYITLTIKMMESAGNSYQNDGFEADIVLTATQTNGSVKKAYSVADINAAAANDTIVLMKDINEPTESVNLNDFANIDLNGYTLTCDGFTLNASGYGTIDFANGRINAGSFTVNAEDAAVNHASDCTITVAGTGVIHVAQHSYNLFGKLQAAELDLKGETKFVARPGSVLATNTITAAVGVVAQQQGGSTVTNVAGDSKPDGAELTPVEGETQGGTQIPAGAVAVTPQTAQDTLNTIPNGATVYFAPGNYDALELNNRPGSDIVDQAADWNPGKNLVVTDTIKNLTLLGDQAVITGGFKAGVGHNPNVQYDTETGYYHEQMGSHYYKKTYIDGLTIKGFTFKGCRMEFGYYYGNDTTSFGSVKNLVVENNVFLDIGTSNSAQAINAGCSTTGVFENWIIRNNRVENAFQGFYIQNVCGLEVSGNVIKNTVHNAIAVQSDASGARGRILLQNNTIEKASDRAIRFGNLIDAQVTITGNTFIASGDSDGEILKTVNVDAASTISVQNNLWKSSVDAEAVPMPTLEKAAGEAASNLVVRHP
ncbi:SipW-dependent-type signal peptide-containing protein [Candidatus Soleaferrea massiliensis]|uniref:SipW-dependent-type signal peptide-containing protein n=1 Tax=Candidatus Soleaferrea massiliensis TaxID=1470354 RepID=UPI00058EE2E2|nr:right-handed parallel beta-helix repeat-containing protein [Candidatus Soleaferrea massiliensis]